MRPVSRTPGGAVLLVRPLLGWRRAELQQVCASVGVTPLEDPSNEDEQFERVRIRQALAAAEWLDPRALALSAGNLAQADAALDWSAAEVWNRLVEDEEKSVAFDPAGIPREIRRRLINRAVMKLATEGRGGELRGRELDRLLQVLAKGGKATLRGVLCTGGNVWHLERAPSRRIS
jgi:tRNA(Ile)-lysidine synthase